MNLYQSLGRWYVQFDWADPVNGYRLAIGRHAEPITDQYAADDVPHPFGDPDALTGNITAPITAQSFRAIKEAHEDSPQAMNQREESKPYNPVNQHTGD